MSLATHYSREGNAARLPSRGWIPSFCDWLGAGIDFLYPAGCALCGTESPKAVFDHTAGFCPPCWEKLAASHQAACLRCGGTIGPHQDPQAGCYYCRDEKYAFSRVIRLGIYRDDLGAACARVKGPAVRLAASLGRLTWNLHEQEFLAEPIDAVVSVPRRWWQAFHRPHHAADTLAGVWGGCLQVPLLTSILKKVRWTRQQTVLSPTERRTNLKNAFTAAVPNAWQGKTILLADDVMTTGATVQEATKALLKAGIGRVIVAVVGRGLGQHKVSR